MDQTKKLCCLGSQNHLNYQEDEDIETQGRPTGVTVESQVSGNIPENQLPPFFASKLETKGHRSRSLLQIQVVSTDQVFEARQEETEVKGEDQNAANVRKPHQKVTIQ